MKEQSTPLDLKDSSNESDGVLRSVSHDDLVWFAGIFDGEGSCGLRIHQKRPANVIAIIHFGLSSKKYVEFVRNIVLKIIPGATATLHRQGSSKLSTRAFWMFYVGKKIDVYKLAMAMIPYVKVKRLELLLLITYLDIALKEEHHRATALDRAMCEISSRLKKGDETAESEGEALIRQCAPHLVHLLEVPTFS